MARILVVGSIAEDDVVRLGEPLNRGAHVEGRGEGARLGGGGPNTAVALARAGHSVALVAPVGNDAAGARLVGELVEAGIDTSLIAVVDGIATTRSVVMIEEGGERTIVNLTRAAEPTPPARLLAAPADWLYVRSRALDLAPLLAEKAKTCRVVAHVPPVADGARPAHVLVGSESDLGADVLADPFAAGGCVAGPLLKWVVVTRGASGAMARGAGGVRIERAARAVKAIDTTGAGDAFAAGLVHALAVGRPMEDALAVAVAWGTESVLWEGSQLPAEAVARLVDR